MAAGVSLLSDLSHTSRAAGSGENSTDMDPVSVRVPTAKYTKVGETLRHVIPGHMQCSMACGGRACKYENPSRWSDEEQAIKGLYSSWITDKLLAMARPSTEIIEKYNIIDQFQRCGLKTVINLQRPGEHASCGNPLETESGFTYHPEVFMEAGIYFYNFGWKDYGVASLTTILDMVKVMSFAVQEGKMAVHCHAGLGRTGVLIACYLVFTSRMSADQAILFVRAKRPNSIQTRGQLLCVREFAQFLMPLRSVFSCAEPKTNSVTLSQYLTRQRHLLHGYEARQMRHVPKIVHLVCRLLQDVAEGRQTVEEEVLEISDLTAEVEKTVSQQAIQQLGKEMRGKGIPMPSSCSSEPPALPNLLSLPPNDQPLPSDQEYDMLWPGQNADNASKALLALKRNLSYSDSALHKLGSKLQPFESPGNSLTRKLFSKPLTNLCASQNTVVVSETQTGLAQFPLPQDTMSSPKCASLTGSSGSIDEPRKEFDQKHDFPNFQRRNPLKETKRSKSFAFSEWSKNGDCSDMVSSWRTERKAELQDDRKPCNVLEFSTIAEGHDDKEIVTGTPFTAETELTVETRCLLVAKALAMDMCGEDLRNRISVWQTELNSREGAWERLCMERDPLLLSSLMWSWLEQLKEPVFSKEDVKALAESHCNPYHALDSLEKGHKQTLLRVLDCAAHLLEIPKDTETDILNRIIKAFTKVACDAEHGDEVYKNLRVILAPVLTDMRNKAMNEIEPTCNCSLVP
ncbi:protein tyrosine phosphatase domain-containing protein 1 [Chanos chanos]|uniref:Protein tyrosine phosphatase domain-containing protein 1 n=1 Tax=Chanos chanos TaxID=29144 RepID=A0A6J2VND8_CHACN|nr:protein tyrosine phosphatase domain-containing protein 1 [Chanos chanos]